MLSGKVPTGGPFGNFTDQFSWATVNSMVLTSTLISLSFWESNPLGIQSFGSEYKGTLTDGMSFGFASALLRVLGKLLSIFNMVTESVVQCDLKPSNVLLDEEMVPYVSDFRITKVFTKYKSKTRTAILGTMGYIAPGKLKLLPLMHEDCQQRETEAYGYDITLMETFTKKKPMGGFFS
ncbi:hypothetical protein AAG906_037522 [Vitis piasezkii]